MEGLTGSDFFPPSLFINHSHLHLMCRSPSPLHVSPSSSKAALLGSVHATPGVAGPRTPAGWWVLRAWACLDQGLNFPLKMRKRFMACSHESVSCSLKLLSWWLLLSWERIILSPPVSFFLFSFFFSSLAFHQLRFCADLLGDLLALALLLHSFPISPLSEYTHPSFSQPPLSSLCFLCCTPLSFSFPLSPLFYPSNT